MDNSFKYIWSVGVLNFILYFILVKMNFMLFRLGPERQNLKKAVTKTRKIQISWCLREIIALYDACLFSRCYNI